MAQKWGKWRFGPFWPNRDPSKMVPPQGAFKCRILGAGESNLLVVELERGPPGTPLPAKWQKPGEGGPGGSLSNRRPVFKVRLALANRFNAKKLSEKKRSRKVFPGPQFSEFPAQVRNAIWFFFLVVRIQTQHPIPSCPQFGFSSYPNCVMVLFSILPSRTGVDRRQGVRACSHNPHPKLVLFTWSSVFQSSD